MTGPNEPLGRRRPSVAARILAPIALLAVTVAVIMIVSASSDGEGGREGGGGKGGGDGVSQTRTDSDKDRPPKKYAVEPGDSLIVIADRFGLTVEEIERLNPDVDPQALVAGQELKLR